MSNLQIRLIEPLPELPGITSGPLSLFADMVDAELSHPDFQIGGLDDTLNQMALDLAAQSQAVRDADQAAYEAALAARDTSDTDTAQLAEDFQGITRNVDLFVNAYRELNQIPPLPELSLTLTPDAIAETLMPLEQVGDALLGAASIEIIVSSPGPAPLPFTGHLLRPAGSIIAQQNKSVVWQSVDTSDARVYVVVNDLPETLFAEGRSGTQLAPWISDGHKFTFILRDYSSGADGAELSRAILDLSPGAGTPAPALPGPATPPLAGGTGAGAGSLPAPAIPALPPPRVTPAPPGQLAPGSITIEQYRQENDQILARQAELQRQYYVANQNLAAQALEDALQKIREESAQLAGRQGQLAIGVTLPPDTEP